MFSAEIRLGQVRCFCSFLFFFLSYFFLIFSRKTVQFISSCMRKGRMFCWLFHHVWKIKRCQNLHWTYFLKKSRLNYIKPQGVLVTVEKSICSFYYTSRLECPYLPRISLLYYTAFWILFNIQISNYNGFSICEILETHIKSFETTFYLCLYIYQTLSHNSLNPKYLYMKGTDTVEPGEMQKSDSISISSHIFMLLGHETWNGT